MTTTSKAIASHPRHPFALEAKRSPAHRGSLAVRYPLGRPTSLPTRPSVPLAQHVVETVPTLVYSDGTAQTNPSLKQVQEKLASLAS